MVYRATITRQSLLLPGPFLLENCWAIASGPFPDAMFTWVWLLPGVHTTLSVSPRIRLIPWSLTYRVLVRPRPIAMTSSHVLYLQLQLFHSQLWILHYSLPCHCHLSLGSETLPTLDWLTWSHHYHPKSSPEWLHWSLYTLPKLSIVNGKGC